MPYYIRVASPAHRDHSMLEMNGVNYDIAIQRTSVVHCILKSSTKFHSHIEWTK